MFKKAQPTLISTDMLKNVNIISNVKINSGAIKLRAGLAPRGRQCTSRSGDLLRKVNLFWQQTPSESFFFSFLLSFLAWLSHVNLNAVNYGTAGDKETGWLINFISALASRKCSDLQNHFRNILEALTLLTTLPTSVSPPLGCDAF